MSTPTPQPPAPKPSTPAGLSPLELAPQPQPAPFPIGKEGSSCTTEGVLVEVRPAFLPEHSSAGERKFTFAYRIRMTNTGPASVQLRRRAWLIITASGERKAVEGEGVVGQQPLLRPGASFEYTSYCPLEEPWGTMEGVYTFERGDGEEFPVRVARFFLVSPHV